MIKYGLNWFRRKSLTFRLSVSILICVLLGGIGLQFFLLQHSKPIIRAHIDDLANKSLQEAISTMRSLGLETESAALTMKNALKELRHDNKAMMQNLLSSALKTLAYDKSDTSHAWIYVFPDGDVKHGTLYTGRLNDNEFSFTATHIEDFYQHYPWFKQVPKEEQTYWSEPYIDVDHPQKPLVSTCLLPFKFAGSKEFDGLVAVSVDLKSVQKEFAEYDFKDRGRFLLLSHEGLYVVHPDKNIEMKKTIFDLAREYNLPQLELTGIELQRGHSGNMLMPQSSVFKSPVIFFYASIPDWKWGICLVFSSQSFFEPLYAFQVKTSIAMLFGLLILFALISIICHHSTKPLLDLSKIALQYGKGDFSATLPENNSNDEIGIMTDAFHKMRTNLLQHIELVKHNASEQQKSLSELQIAEHIQRSVLPIDLPLHPALEVNAAMQPARKIGGDFYDFYFIDEKHFAIVIADVSGKGIPAALYMMTAKALIKTISKADIPLSQVFYFVNKELCLGNNTNTFVTAFLGILDVESGILEYVNAGHNPPFYKDSKGYHMMKTARNLVLGGIENTTYQSEKLQMHAGERIFLYTDGITEAQNRHGAFYGEERLQKLLQKNLQNPSDTMQQIAADVALFADGAEQSDDFTILELLYLGADSGDVVFKADVKNTDDVISYMQQDMDKNKIPADKQSNIIIATEEIFSNIAQYAYQSDGLVRIKTSMNDKTYEIKFSDNGHPYNPLERTDPDITKSIDERDIGGLGIFLVKKMTDKAAYQRLNDQNVLTISINI